MTALGSFEQLVIAAGDALGDAIRAVTSEDGFREMAVALGWDLAHVPGPIGALAAPAQAVRSAAARLGSDPTPGDIEALRVAIAQLIGQLRGLQASAFPAELAELAATFADEALAHSVIEYLFREHRLILHALRVLAIVRLDYAPPTAARGARIRRRILWDNLTTLIRDPAAAYRAAYGWGTPAFDAVGLLGAVQDLLCSLHWPAGLEPLPRGLFDVLAARSPNDPPGPDLCVTLRLLYREEQDALVTAGLRLVPLPGSATRLPALALLPFASSGLAAKFAVDSHLDIELAAGVDLQGGVGVRLSPEDGVSLVLGLADPASAAVGAGTISAAIDIHDPANQPVTLLAAGGATLQVTTAVGRAGATADTLGGHDLFVELELKDARFAFGGSGDGLLASHVPSDASTGLSLAVGFSTRRGLYLRGGNGLTGRVPIGAHLGPLAIDAIDVAIAPRGNGVAVQIGTELAFTVGPVAFVAKGLGLEAAATAGSGRLGVGDVALGAMLPTTIALAIDGPLVQGGGEITRDPEHGRYTGGIAVTIGAFGASAAVVIDTRPPPPARYAFGAAIAATFPAIPLGAGFVLTGVGGVVMLHRTPDLDRLRAGLRAGAIQSLLFPAPNALEAAITGIANLFPPAAGRYVLGPAARIAWGTPQLLRAELAILVELPAPIRIAVLGALELGLPTLDHRIIDLRLDALGVLDLDRRTFALDASLHDSRLAGYELTGDMALRLGWGDQPSFLLAIGGFHPRFTPPASFPALRRLALTAGDNPQLRLDAYLAVTSNTVQVGAHADLSYRGGGFQITAAAGFDGLFEFSPFHFEVDISASASISWHGHHLLGVHLDATLDGPHPWHARGEAGFSILWWDVSVGFDATWGDGPPPALPPPPDIARQLHDALARDESWTGELGDGERPWVTTTPSGRVRIHPFATLVARQRAVPLDFDVTQVGNIPLPAARRFSIASITVGTTPAAKATVTDLFAPAQFTQLAADERLKAPSFEPFASGVRIGAGLDAHGATAPATLDTETIVIDPLSPPADPVRAPFEPGLVAALSMVRAARPAAAAPRGGPALAPLRYALATTDGLAITEQARSIAAGATTYHALAAAARRARAPLQVVPVSETPG